MFIGRFVGGHADLSLRVLQSCPYAVGLAAWREASGAVFSFIHLIRAFYPGDFGLCTSFVVFLTRVSPPLSGMPLDGTMSTDQTRSLLSLYIASKVVALTSRGRHLVRGGVCFSLPAALRHDGEGELEHTGAALARAIQRYRYFAAHGVIPENIAVEDGEDLQNWERDYRCGLTGNEIRTRSLLFWMWRCT
jgi:hypothetical protein